MCVPAYMYFNIKFLTFCYYLVYSDAANNYCPKNTTYWVKMPHKDTYFCGLRWCGWRRGWREDWYVLLRKFLLVLCFFATLIFKAEHNYIIYFVIIIMVCTKFLVSVNNNISTTYLTTILLQYPRRSSSGARQNQWFKQSRNGITMRVSSTSACLCIY